MQSFKEFNSQTIHPKLSKYGKVVIENPHKDSPLEHWKDSNKHATITPESKLNITFHSTDEDYDEIDTAGGLAVIMIKRRNDKDGGSDGEKYAGCDRCGGGSLSLAET